MKKKVFVILILSVLIIPIQAFASYEPGILFEKKIGFIRNDGYPNSAFTDGNLTTTSSMTGTYSTTAKFNSPVSLNAFRVLMNSGNPTMVLKLNGQAVYQTVLSSTMKFEELKTLSKDYMVDEIFLDSAGSFGITEIEFYSIELEDVTPPAEVSNVSNTTSQNSITLQFTLPTDTDFSHIELWRDGAMLRERYTDTIFIDNNLQPDTEYTYQIFTLDAKGNKSSGVNFKVRTDYKPVGEVQNVRVEVDYDAVNLSWNSPIHKHFQHVNIYRAAAAGETVSIMAAPTKIFETNGTYFNDLTVQPETTYDYRLTTFSSEGVESDGIQKTVTTLEAPPPVIEGGSYTKDPLTGNFIYSWESPAYGQVKVLIGETLFNTVDASLKKITIPNNQMKYTPFGDPDITLIAVDGDKTSPPVRPGKDGQASGDTLDQIKVPFNAQDLLGSGVALLFIIGPFILLGLAFLLVPKFRTAVLTALNGGRGERIDKDGRNEREGRLYRESAPERGSREQREKVMRESRTPREYRGERG